MSIKILLIDDDEDEQCIFTEALKKINDPIKCLFAVTPQQGLKLLNQSLPDFVFLDMNMPALNGLQLLEIIKKNDRLKQIPVIMYSTTINQTFTNTAVSKGAFACIKKKDTIQELADTLKKLISKNS